MNIDLDCRNGNIGRMLECELKSTGYTVFGAFNNDKADAVITDDPNAVFDVPTFCLKDYSGKTDGCIDVTELLNDIRSTVHDSVNTDNSSLMYYYEPDKKINIGETCIRLSNIENRIFAILFQAKGKYVSAKVISERLNGGKADLNYIRFYICSIRKKLSEVTDRKLIKTDRNGGYGLFI